MAKVLLGSTILNNRLAKVAIKFHAVNNEVFSLQCYHKGWYGKLEYSTDAAVWHEWNGEKVTCGIESDDNALYLRGTNNTAIDSTFYLDADLTTTKISCTGNIETLLDYETVLAGNHPAIGYQCFFRLFADCKRLISAPELPAITLAGYCYYGMFSGCESLIQAPKLPAINLAHNCYNSMFGGCTSLTQTPELPAHKLYWGSYWEMFRGCTSLTTVSILPIETLGQGSCQYMFDGCTSLYVSDTQTEEAPYEWRIPSDGVFLNTESYNQESMFSGCLGTRSSDNMSGAPGEFHTYYTQNKPISLSSSAKLTFYSKKPFTLKIQHYWDGILQYSADTINWTTLTGSQGEYHQLASVNNKLYFRGIGNTVITGNEGMYNNLEGSKVYCIGNIESLLDYELVSNGKHPIMGEYCYAWLFSNFDSLVQAPELLVTTLTKGCYQGMFAGCTSLVEAPELSATTLAEDCYRQMFAECTSLVEVPALPATILAKKCYSQMFSHCTGIEYLYLFWKASELAEECYASMFEYCTNLELSWSASNLPATILPKNCYLAMFKDCSKVKLSETYTSECRKSFRIPESGEGTIIGESAGLETMFEGTGGSYTGPVELNTTYYINYYGH